MSILFAQAYWSMFALFFLGQIDQCLFGIWYCKLNPNKVLSTSTKVLNTSFKVKQDYESDVQKFFAKNKEK